MKFLHCPLTSLHGWNLINKRAVSGKSATLWRTALSHIHITPEGSSFYRKRGNNPYAFQIYGQLDKTISIKPRNRGFGRQCRCSFVVSVSLRGHHKSNFATNSTSRAFSTFTTDPRCSLAVLARRCFFFVAVACLFSKCIRLLPPLREYPAG